jgi:DNA-binding PadR family transcriptional regulator
VLVGKVDVVVLGSLADKPCHGYELLERLREAGTGLGATVGKASVYQCLQRLERDGLIVGRAQEGTDGPDRRVFRVTRRGRARFAEGLEERFADATPFETEAGLALGFVGRLGPAGAQRAIDARERALRELKDGVETQGARGTGADMMRARQRMLADAELAWLDEFRASLREHRP